MKYSIPIVSVIVPAYNASLFISQAIESVLAQTFTDFELLIVDDGSTDSTTSIAKRYCQQDSRIRLFSQANKGVSAARNVGIQMTQGKLIAFLDADDQWLPDKLAAQIEHLNSHPSVGVSFGRVEFVNQDGMHTGQYSTARLTGLKSQDFLYGDPTSTTSNWVVRREVFEQVGVFDEDMSYSEDTEWLFRVIFSTQWQIEGIAQVLVCYRTNKTGLSSDLYRMEEGWNRLVNKAREYAPELVNQHYSLARASNLQYLARRAFRLGLPSQVGVDFMTRALQSDWKLILKKPRQTLLRAMAVYGAHLLRGLSLRNKTINILYQNKQ